MDASILYKAANIDSALNDPEVAHLVVSHNKVLSSRTIDGLEVQAKEITEGIDLSMTVKEKIVIKKPVHLCFGMLVKSGVQNIIINLNVEKDASIFVLAHCVFPEAVNVKHVMDAKINVAENAHYAYLERHIHGLQGGVEVYPKAKVTLNEKARFRTDFELMEGRVGKIEIDYETTCQKESVMEMTAKISGSGDDIIKIQESGNLIGEAARGVLTSRVAVRENAKAEVYNKLIATAPYARGHVDCKEIVQDNAIASAIPIVEVNHPKAHITHEAAIGSVDSKQLQTLMARGLSEEEAVKLIIQGLLS